LDEIVKMSRTTDPRTWCHIPEDVNPQHLCSENFKCHSPYIDYCNCMVMVNNGMLSSKRILFVVLPIFIIFNMVFVFISYEWKYDIKWQL